MPSSGVQKCALDRKSTRLNSSHTIISYAVFCLKKNVEAIVRPYLPRVTGEAGGPADAPRIRAPPDPPPHARRRHFIPSEFPAPYFFFLKSRRPREITSSPHPAPFPS